MVGSYMGRVFTVSSQRILTPSNLKGSAGSDWANHEIIGKKARSQWVGPKLKSYTMDLLLRAQDGVSPGPRWTTSSGRRKARWSIGSSSAGDRSLTTPSSW